MKCSVQTFVGLARWDRNNPTEFRGLGHSVFADWNCNESRTALVSLTIGAKSILSASSTCQKRPPNSNYGTVEG